MTRTTLPRFRTGVLLVALMLLPLAGCRTGGGSGGREAALIRVSEARELGDRGFGDEGLALLRLVLEEDPRFLEAHLGEAHIYRGRGDTEAALAAYQRAEAIDPSSFPAAYGSALMQHLGGRLDEAVDGYLRALRLEAESFDAARDLAAAYLQLGQPERALAPAQRATRLDPSSQPAWSNLAVTQAMLGRWDDVIASYRRAAELGSLDDPMLLGLANAHLTQGNYERAINVLASLQRRKPSLRGHERLAYAYLKLERPREALDAYEQALAIEPADVASLNGSAIAHLTLHHRQPAASGYHRITGVDRLRRSLRESPQQARIVDLLARYGG
ncbi:tetratricopeptide repeat protein [Phycisphaera mikurensis]|uniref:Uncharacterized protein n=1 Tax=Phycisphaera mikurensis (strain NBRC 102666 / KCTC 22515 / FYK2301M01) TaxID=1142394 RepID=I0IB69_PHYMF|nr:tetratricopeptide repeat protein [Phycisphaera mikurensis]MBB6443006.1 tetratricopeptide (TPR) repeat protein [Phycisphaera mikurensis]BAM02507.1 hypothetical protein PSMK_03480 [Phycisphaera mikurensis NBRC 102666]